jgi:hypothetical protein
MSVEKKQSGVMAISAERARKRSSYVQEGYGSGHGVREEEIA